MAGKTIVAALTIFALGAGSAAAQTVDDLVAIFPAAGWTAQATDNPTVSCVAAFDNGNGARGYDIRLSNGTRYGELRFAWQGTEQLVAYDLDFSDGGTRANRASLSWGDRHRSFGSVSLAEAIERAEDPLAAAVLQLVWSADFCAPAVGLAAMFPADGWTPVAIETPLNGIFTCVTVFGPTEDNREGYHFATADGAYGGALTFFGDENDRWTLSYRRDSEEAGGRVAASIRGGGGNFATMNLTMNITLPMSPFPGAEFSEDARLGTAMAHTRYLLEELTAYLAATTFCP